MSISSYVEYETGNMYSFVQSQRASAVALQNVSSVNRKHFRLAAASVLCDSTKHNGLVTQG